MVERHVGENREKKILSHVQGTVALVGQVLTLGEGATLATRAVPAIVAAMGVAVVHGIAVSHLTRESLKCKSMHLARLITSLRLTKHD